MESTLLCSALARQDGSDADGIHLLWTAPDAVGYSVKGFDIQRRKAIKKQKPKCIQLTDPELNTLHETLRLRKSETLFAVRQASCPSFPSDIPDQPYEEDEKERVCINFSKDRITLGPNPINIEGIHFSVFDHSGQLKPDTRFRKIANQPGLDCGFRLNIQIPHGTPFVELTLAHTSRPAKLLALNSDDKEVASAAMTKDKGEKEVIRLEGDDIRSVIIDAPQNEIALFQFCFRPGRRRCIRYSGSEQTCGKNPRKDNEVSVTVYDEKQQKFPRTEIVSWRKSRGLNCGFCCDIEFINPVAQVELTLVHFASPGIVEIFNSSGKNLGKKKLNRKQGIEQKLQFVGKDIKKVVIRTHHNETLLVDLCFTRSAINIKRILNAVKPQLVKQFENIRAVRFNDIAGIVATHRVSPNEFCLAYDIRFPQSYTYTRVRIGVPAVLAIAMREGKAVDAQLIQQALPVQDVQFGSKRVDQVVLYVNHAAKEMTVCFLQPVKKEQEEEEWKDVPYIARNIQLPIRTLNSDLSNTKDEQNLAQSRLLPSESLSGSTFKDVSRLMNEAAQNPQTASPMKKTTLTREEQKDPFIELRPWPFSLSMLMDLAWRRILGFGYLDKGSNLRPGDSYDYRITGYFYRKDIEEQFFGFHTVPSGLRLPGSFHLGPILLQTYQSTTVDFFPNPPGDVLEFTGRKGIRLLPKGLFNRSLKITFPTPITHVVLELEPDTIFDLQYKAKTSDYLSGLSAASFTGPVDRKERAEFKFDEPIDTLILKGHGFLYGIRLYNDGAPNGDPLDILKVRCIIYGIKYSSSPLPSPPLFLGTTHLQEPILPGDPAITTQNPPNNMGFRLHWLPPPPTGSIGPLPWPEDLGAFPPFDVLGFKIERRRVDTGESYQALTPEDERTLFFGNRGRRFETEPLYNGVDILRVYPESKRPSEGASIFMEIDDVLISANINTAPPGSLFQYRIFSTDPIGRQSAAATVGSIVRLEKHIPPPQPTEPTTPLSASGITPSGVRARVIQKTDPNITSNDQMLLGNSDNAVVLEWGWTDVERSKDPYAREFRVYWLDTPPDRIQGQLTGTASFIGGRYRMTATMAQSVETNALKGKYIRAGSYPFKVATNTAGENIAIDFEPSVLDASQVPGAASFLFHPILNGEELRPGEWQERTAVIPITTSENYQYIFYDRLTINSTNHRVRVWVGVSASDDQSYVTDEIPASETNGGRPGNESSIAAVVVEARYYGRPDFSPPPPLADVPEQVTDEPRTESISFSLNLPALLPSVAVPGGHSILLERLAVANLISMIGVNASDQITMQLPDGTSTSYTLANLTDHNHFTNQIKTGDPGRIENKFLMDALIRHLNNLEKLWQRVEGVNNFTLVLDTVPSKAERFIHRVRMVDQAGHISQEGVIVPQVLRVVSTRTPAAPQFTVDNSQDDNLSVEVKVRDAFDNKWIILFTLEMDIMAPLDERSLEKAQLLRLPNRRDLYPDHGIRLRLRDGTLIQPSDTADIQTGTVEIPDRLLTIDLNPGFEKRVAVWAVTMTRDGIASNFSGPHVVITGPTPMVVPDLTVTVVGNQDQAAWTVLTVKAEISLERSTDGGSTWSRVTPWLPSKATQRNIVSVPGTRHYRLVLRGRRGEKMTGSAFGPVT